MLISEKEFSEEKINFEGYEEIDEEERKLIEEGLKSENLSGEGLWKEFIKP